MRSAAATTAAILAVVAALGSAVVWTAGRNLLDEDRFADRVVAALGSTSGRAAVTVNVVQAVHERPPVTIPTSEEYAVVARAVDIVADSPGFSAALRPAAVAAQRQLVEEPGEPVELDLGALRGPLAPELAALDPRLAARLPAAPDLVAVRVSTGLEVPVIPGSGLAGRVPGVAASLALVAALLAAAALALSDRPGGTARRMASALIFAALVPAAIGVLVPRVAEAAVGPPDQDLARDLAERLLSGWIGPAIALAGAAVALFALSALRGGEGPRIRPRGG